MGNYAACKKYTQKEKNQFILLTRSHFSLIAKNCVSLGTHTLPFFPQECRLSGGDILRWCRHSNPMCSN